jgi:trehalose 6-phosphate phosphatase
MSAPEPRTATDLVRSALTHEPAGLLTDLDGTLAPIVSDPTAVVLAAGARDALARLARKLAVVGFITGRAAADARRIAGLPELLVVGNHGLEWLDPGGTQPRHAVDRARTAALLRAALGEVPAEPGLAIDEKGLSATIHYRNSPRPARARSRILAALAQLPDGLELREGRLSVELRPAGAGDKGTALRQVVAGYRLRGLVVAGDDLTDLDMFRAAAEMRAGGELAAAIVAVGGRGEVPGEVAEAADATVAGPAELVALLAAI